MQTMLTEDANRMVCDENNNRLWWTNY